jgi:hypothetical protein
MWFSIARVPMAGKGEATEQLNTGARLAEASRIDFNCRTEVYKTAHLRQNSPD